MELRRGVNTHSYTEAEIARAARFAFNLARTRRNHVTSVDKANVMEAGALWREVVGRIHREEFADVGFENMLADNCAIQLARAPTRFDVLVTDNLFGDLLSDAAGAIIGSLGMLPSASLSEADASGRRRALYEPIHGSAPDIAGKGIANPLGAILSVAMLLRWSAGRPADADHLESAVAAALARGARTGDIAAPGEAVMGTRSHGRCGDRGPGGVVGGRANDATSRRMRSELTHTARPPGVTLAGKCEEILKGKKGLRRLGPGPRPQPPDASFFLTPRRPAPPPRSGRQSRSCWTAPPGRHGGEQPGWCPPPDRGPHPPG
jgi:hypothetical protein